MCLSLFAWKAIPGYDLIFLSNRDEFQVRPTLPVDFWEDAPQMIAGKDVEAGGSWLAASKSRKFANLTNYRDFNKTPIEQAPTRGNLVKDFVLGTHSPEEYLANVDTNGKSYNGFSLLVTDMKTLHFHCNSISHPKEVQPGMHGLSNHVLDTPWPKVKYGTNRMEKILKSGPEDLESLFNLMRDTTVYPDNELPDTGAGLKFERMASPLFIENPVYGTRSTTIVIIRSDGSSEWVERRFDEDARFSGESTFSNFFSQ